MIDRKTRPFPVLRAKNHLVPGPYSSLASVMDNNKSTPSHDRS